MCKYGKRSTDGIYPDRKSSQVLQDCTIYVSCGSTSSGSVVSGLRETRESIGGNPRLPGARWK